MDSDINNKVMRMAQSLSSNTKNPNILVQKFQNTLCYFQDLLTDTLDVELYISLTFFYKTIRRVHIVW